MRTFKNIIPVLFVFLLACGQEVRYIDLEGNVVDTLPGDASGMFVTLAAPTELSSTPFTMEVRNGSYDQNLVESHQVTDGTVLAMELEPGDYLLEVPETTVDGRLCRGRERVKVKEAMMTPVTLTVSCQLPQSSSELEASVQVTEVPTLYADLSNDSPLGATAFVQTSILKVDVRHDWAESIGANMVHFYIDKSGSEVVISDCDVYVGDQVVVDSFSGWGYEGHQSSYTNIWGEGQFVLPASETTTLDLRCNVQASDGWIKPSLFDVHIEEFEDQFGPSEVEGYYLYF